MNLEKFEPIAYYSRYMIYYGLYAQDWGYYCDSEFILNCYSLECRLPFFRVPNVAEMKIPNKKFEFLETIYLAKKKNLYRWEPSQEEYKKIVGELATNVTATTTPENRKRYKEVLNAVLKFRKNKNRGALRLKEVLDKVYTRLREKQFSLLGTSSAGAGTLYIFSDATNGTAS